RTQIGLPGLGVVDVGGLGNRLGLLGGGLILLVGMLGAAGERQAGGQRDGGDESELTHDGHLLFRVAWEGRRCGPCASADAWPVAPPDARNRRYRRRGGRSRAPATRK